MLSFSIYDLPLVTRYIVLLVLLEGLLSADNALVLAVMVRHLPKKQQRKVLFYGIWGAVGFRVVALFLSAILLKFWLCKVIGGGYLLYLAIAHFWSKRHDHVSAPGPSTTQGAESPATLRGFWGTVASITMADIAFSIDSILTAVSIADDFPERFGINGKLFIVFVGGVLGVITMRFVVRYFLILLDRFPGLAEGAYHLVAWIGLKLLVNGLHDGQWVPFHISEAVFWAGMLAIVVISLVVKPRERSAGEVDVSASLDLLEGPEEDSSDESEDDAPEGTSRTSDDPSAKRRGVSDGNPDGTCRSPEVAHDPVREEAGGGPNDRP